ncbi:P-loop containing nucleoside triphosphate hydrolase protein [Catenaria anguillulae PL171]|uniref:p-loop containing nucleoside triphosphate hydrolase protein n=1 Tax=Catenaria anguillulae PL171 TaxID=765915 RepID=A0A1Y2GH85_9FUNG|nr:P-loop containing nucleoside triphosphate hydrolase protein [Catenaria anguillulae PL171]
MPLGDRAEFRVMGEDDDVAEERKKVFDKGTVCLLCAYSWSHRGWKLTISESVLTDVDAAVRIGNLRKVYRNSLFFASKTDKVAVRSLCLTLGEGELLALLGQNGAGKSTTMSMLSGLTPPSAGDAVIFGKSVTEDMDEIRANIGICPQHDLLFNDLTPIEHIELYGGSSTCPRPKLKVCKERLEAVV